MLIEPYAVALFIWVAVKPIIANDEERAPEISVCACNQLPLADNTGVGVVARSVEGLARWTYCMTCRRGHCERKTVVAVVKKDVIKIS